MATMALLLMLALGSAADSTFASRPDLAPPKLNITIPCSDSRCGDGLLFVAPFSGFQDALGRKPAQPGAYILTNTGDLIWSGFTYFAPWNANFQAARWKGRDVLFSFEGRHNGPHGHAHGHHTILDNHYETVRELRAGRHYLSDKHEFNIVDERTALIQVYHPLEQNLTEFGGGPNQTWIVDAIFQELDIESGELLFEWHSLDHISPNESMLPLPKGEAGSGHNSSTAWDYFHINSIAKGKDGHYLVSGRHASTVLKVNSSDGSVIWRLGGRHSSFILGKDVEFGFQHDARYLPGGNESMDLISLFDNSAHGEESSAMGQTKIYPFSRGKYIAIDHKKTTATLMKAFHPPNNDILSTSQGSLQTLPGGNVLINWGSEGQLTEYNSNGDIVFHAHLDSGDMAVNVHNYRGFKYNWTGFSPETPALKAERSEGRVRMFASWNGDTRTESWRFSWIQQLHGQRGAKVKEYVTKRTGFETCLETPDEGLDIHSIRVFSEALDRNGAVLASSDTMPIVAAIRSFYAEWQRC